MRAPPLIEVAPGAAYDRGVAGVGASSQSLAATADPERARPPPNLLADAKLRPPAARQGMVVRTSLLERLGAAVDVPVVSVVAPAGYGKSALVDQWAGETTRRVAWLSLEADDNDPAVLLRYIAAALARVGRLDASGLKTRAMPGTSVAAVVARRVAATLASIGAPVTVVLDNTDVLHNHQCRDAIGELALHLPTNAQLVVVSRSTAAVPLPALRARGAVLEIGATDLAMGEDEARALLAGAGVTLTDAELSALVEQTEGWAVGLYLAALAHRAGGPTRPEAFSFAGDDRLMADYLRTELLDRIPRGRQQFLLRTSVLDRMCGPLCDAVLGTRRSGGMLEALEASNLLLVPLDRRREWYRYHPLFRQLLRAELERREGELVPELHARAARWCEDNGLTEAAIDHARATGDTDLVARLVASNLLTGYAAGHLETVGRWVEWFEERGVVDRYPAVAVLSAALAALMGQPAAAERRAAIAERAPRTTTVPDGSSFESWQAVVRALMCRRGVAEMRRDAALAYDGLAPTSQWRATARVLEGVGWLLEGDRDRAEVSLAQAAAAAFDLGAYPVGAAALAEGALVAIDRADWPAAESGAARALSVVRARQLDDVLPSAFVYAVAARTAVHAGDMARAQDCLAHAARLRPQLTYALPYLAVQTLVELARTYLAVADAAGARMVLREAVDVLRMRPDLGILVDQVAELRAALEAFDVGAVGASALTTAELRLVPLLSTHLSFREIGERLHISRHTVKTQAVSLYRKLGVSSRSEAISSLDAVGLLGS